MKKVASLLLILLICIPFTACLVIDDVTDGQKKEPYKEAFSAVTEEPKKKETFGLNESAVFENLKITMTEVKETVGDGFFEADKGKIYVGAKFVIENISQENQSVSTWLLFDAYADGVKCETSLSAECVFDEGTLDGTITPGKKLVGWYTLEAPENWSEIELQVKSSWLSHRSAEFIIKK